MPTGLSFTSADADGVEAGGLVSWIVDLAASGQATLRTEARVGTPPDDLLRLASVACAAISESSTPIVCASDADLLPAGAAAEAAPTAPPTQDPGDPGWVPLAAGGAAAVLIIGGVLLGRARRQRRRAP